MHTSFLQQTGIVLPRSGVVDRTRIQRMYGPANMRWTGAGTRRNGTECWGVLEENGINIDPAYIWGMCHQSEGFFRLPPKDELSRSDGRP